MALTFDYIREMNKERSKDWHRDSKPWTVADWSNAAAGEMGEVCNKVKKLRRIETGMTVQRSQSADPDVIRGQIGEEVADTFLYLDLLCAHLGIDMELAILHKFNRVSVEQGFPQRLFIDPSQRSNEGREASTSGAPSPSMGSVDNT